MLARMLGVALFLSISLAVQAGPARFEEVLKDLLGTMDKLTTTLATIRDQDSASAAKPELRKSAGHWQALLKKAEDVAPPNKEEKEQLEKAYAGKLEEARKKLFGEVQRVRAVPGGREALKEISGVLSRKPKEKD
jgi:hypothetical protein